MLHTAIELFTGSSLVDLPHARGRFQGATAISTQNGSVKQFVAADLLPLQQRHPDEIGNYPKLCFHPIHVQASSEAA